MKNYAVGTDKVLAKLDSPTLSGWISVTSIDELKTYAKNPVDREKCPEPVWKGTKFPASLMQQVIGTIRQFPRMETAYSLYYNIRKKEWAVKCPDQNGSGASVSYEDDGTGMPEGFAIIGSIHTHPEMSAFWSGVDLNDQKKKHGIHFVFGLRNGYVSEYKCTVFTPTEQYDQNLEDVVEEFDWSQSYEPVAEWVEIIKKQAYKKPQPVSITKYYGGGHTSVVHKPLPKTHYGHEETAQRNYEDFMENYSSAASFVDDYGYWYRPGSWYNSVDVNTEDAEIIDNKYITVLDEALANVAKAEEFRVALTDPKTISELESQLDLVVVDVSEKTTIIEGIEEIASCIPHADKFDNEEQKQIFDALFEVLPDVNLIEPTDPALRNGTAVDTIGYLIDGMVDSYCENPKCIDNTDINSMLQTLKDAYETLLRVQAESDTEAIAQEAKEC